MMTTEEDVAERMRIYKTHGPEALLEYYNAKIMEKESELSSLRGGKKALEEEMEKKIWRRERQ